MAWAVRLRMACSGLLHGVTAGCVLPSFDTRQLRQCENRQSLFSSNYPWYDALRFWCLEKFAQMFPRQLPTEQRNQNISAGRRWCSCNYAVMSKGVTTWLHYNSMGESPEMTLYRRFNDHCYIACSNLNVQDPCECHLGLTTSQYLRLSIDLVPTTSNRTTSSASPYDSTITPGSTTVIILPDSTPR